MIIFTVVLFPAPLGPTYPRIFTRLDGETDILDHRDALNRLGQRQTSSSDLLFHKQFLWKTVQRY